MLHVSIARLTVAALVLHSFSAAAQPLSLDLRGAIARAHRVAPQVIAARGRLAEAEAGVVGANVAFTANPEIEGGVGPRLTPDRPIDVELRIGQDIEPWRRGPRRRLARAEVGRARADAEVELRELDLEVSLAFAEALFAERAGELARHARDLAERGASVADRRRQAGDVTDLDANLARAALGRAASAVQAADSERSLAVGRLATLIGAATGEIIVLRGELEPSPVPEPSAIRGSLVTRADVRAFDAQREVAAAQHAQATAHGRPELGVWAAYQREDTADVVLGGLRMSLPFWNRAQGEKAAARAKEHGVIQTRDATLRVAARQVDDTFAAYASAKASVDSFERAVVPLLDDSERLLQKTIDAGQIAVGDYLVARQELLNGRREYLERLLALAKAAAGARFVAGVAP